MLPKPPPREASIGFLYIPPYRVQGISVAGEVTCVQIPELDVCFDIGASPRAVLSSKYIALSHGHMDHIGGLAYYFSQRRFQGMGTGTVICDARIASALRRMIEGYIDLEQQKTPFEIIALDHEEQVEIKNNIFLRAFHTDHTCPSIGFSIIENRSKLRPEFLGLPQEKLKELKNRGEKITRTLEIPLIAYIGDTLPGPHLVREDVRKAKIVISECTFFEAEHKERAKIGKHLHVDDIIEWLGVLEADALVLTHLSRRTHLGYARDRVEEMAKPELVEKILFLMDHRTNRVRYEQQLEEAERLAVQ